MKPVPGLDRMIIVSMKHTQLFHTRQTVCKKIPTRFDINVAHHELPQVQFCGSRVTSRSSFHSYHSEHIIETKNITCWLAVTSWEPNHDQFLTECRWSQFVCDTYDYVFGICYSLGLTLIFVYLNLHGENLGFIAKETNIEGILSFIYLSLFLLNYKA